jgi:hypothetical protein
MLRILMVGGSSSEAKILQSLSELVSANHTMSSSLLSRLCIHARVHSVHM